MSDDHLTTLSPPVALARLETAMRSFDADHRDKGEWTGWEDNQAHKFAIWYHGRIYPVKMIVSMATGKPRRKFSGGVAPGDANSIARRAGVDVVALRPDWTRDELILALELYLRLRGRRYTQESPEIAELSAFLKQIGPILHGMPVTDRFRNANGVYMKLMNFRRLDPGDGQHKGLSHGNRLEQEVWDEFGADLAKCSQAADDVRAAIRDLHAHPEWSAPMPDEGEIEAEEGKAVTRVHIGRERNRQIVKRKKAAALKTHKRLTCEACAFDFKAVYGERGSGFIECHHEKPIHAMKPGEKTKLSDLRLVCANCHRMIHAGRPWLTVAELKASLNSARLPVIKLS